MIRYVRQRHDEGCGLACLAMVTGKTYGQVCKDLASRRYVWLNGGRLPGFHGIGINVLDLYLARNGFWLQRRYRSHYVRVPRLGSSRHPRWTNTTEWPCPPWAADGHVAQVTQPSGKGHFVVMLPNGGVLDPLRKGIFSLREWDKIDNICGLARCSGSVRPV